MLQPSETNRLSYSDNHRRSQLQAQLQVLTAFPPTIPVISATVQKPHPAPVVEMLPARERKISDRNDYTTFLAEQIDRFMESSLSMQQLRESADQVISSQPISVSSPPCLLSPVLSYASLASVHPSLWGWACRPWPSECGRAGPGPVGVGVQAQAK